MLIALPVFSGDVSRLSNLLSWIGQLGGCHGHHAVIVSDADTPSSDIIRIQSKASTLFDALHVVSNESPVNGWIPGANSLFLTAAKHAGKSGMPWLFLEPDAVPLKPGWADQLEITYRALGCRYMGRLVPCQKPGLPPHHFTGVGIYPPHAFQEIGGMILDKAMVAFDLSTADYLTPIAHNSNLFQHLWGEVGKPPVFSDHTRQEEGIFGLSYLQPQAVIFHRNKDGSLIELLRKRAGINPRTYIQLGRLGDIILLMPAMKWIFENEGVRPRLIVSDENASVMEGVSYVEPVSLNVHWWYGMKEARAYADKHFGGATVIQCHADRYTCDVNQWPNFMQSTHSRTGVPMELLTTLPMVFDRRNHERELSHVPSTNGKPYILVNTIGFSSPFPHHADLWSRMKQFKNRIDVIDLATIKLPRIFDLLGIYDRALGTVHIDTSTLHLAAGSPSPYIAFTRGGWASAIPRGNCVLQMEYAEYPKRLHEVFNTINSWSQI